MSFISCSELFKRTITSIVLGSCFIFCYMHSFSMFALMMIIILLLILFFEWPRLVDFEYPYVWVVSVFYPCFPFLCLIYLNYFYRFSCPVISLYPFLTAWTADTFGYFVGKFFGRHKIYPTISPGKSWEGLFGSFVGILMLNLIIFFKFEKEFFSLFFHEITFLYFLVVIVISVLFTVVAFLGGMLISILKRFKGLKDVSDVLPGHGGFLDRFDSVMFTALTTFLLILLL